MPTPTKPGVPWRQIRERYEAGERPSTIARLLAQEGIQITRQAIQKRARKEGWPEGEKTAPVAPPRCLQKHEKPAATAQDLASPSVSTAPAVPLSPELRNLAIKNIREGATESLTAKRIGVTKAAFDAWKERDPDFAMQIDQAVAEYATARIANITDAAERGDWKASQFMLETHPATKAEFSRDKNGGAAGLTVNLKFDLVRGAPVKEEDVLVVDFEEVG